MSWHNLAKTKLTNNINNFIFKKKKLFAQAIRATQGYSGLLRAISINNIYTMAEAQKNNRKRYEKFFKCIKCQYNATNIRSDNRRTHC